MKRTYQPSVIIQKRRHGYLKRSMNNSGRNILSNRRRKGRKRLSH